MTLTNYLANKIVDHVCRDRVWVRPPELWLALVAPNKGQRLPSTSYATTDFVIPATANGRLYRCETSGTSGTSIPAWTSTDGGTTTDGTVVWREQTLVLKAGIVAEVAGLGYTRVAVPPGYASWKGTGGEVTDTPSAGTSGTARNNSVAAFAAAQENWGLVTHTYIFDGITGSGLWFGACDTPQFIGFGATMAMFSVDALAVRFW